MTNHEEMMRLLTQGMDTMLIDAQYNNVHYQLPACRRRTDECFRISHKTLLYFYQIVRKRFKDVKICMEPAWKKCEVGYCIAACTVETKDGKSDLYFGENRVSTFTSSVDMNNPFQIAVNRAMDKAILYEIFGLPSRFFDNNGNPDLSKDSDNYKEEDGPANNTQTSNQPQAAQTAKQQPAPIGSNAAANTATPVPQGNASAGSNAPDQAALEKEFAELGAYTIPLRSSDGTTGNTPLKDVKVKILEYFSKELSGKEGAMEKERKEKIDRFLELQSALRKKPA